MDFVLLEDRDVHDFNFAPFFDPSLMPGNGPGHRQLYRMAIEARKGGPAASFEFAQTMDWTLTPEAFESFQRTFGARPIKFADWFFSKLYQFLGILLHQQLLFLGTWSPPATDTPWNECPGDRLTHDGCNLDLDELERAFAPADHTAYDWGELVERCSQAQAADRRNAALEFVRACASQRRGRKKLDVAKGERPRGDEEVSGRDQFIAEQLLQGTARAEICELLDKRRDAVTDNMWKQGIRSWSAAWADPEFRKDAQSIFSKAQRRFTSSE